MEFTLHRSGDSNTDSLTFNAQSTELIELACSIEELSKRAAEIDGLKLDSRKGGDRFSRMEPGQIVEWKVRRGAKTFTVTTRAGERP